MIKGLEEKDQEDKRRLLQAQGCIYDTTIHSGSSGSFQSTPDYTKLSAGFKHAQHLCSAWS